jgi:biotin carboxyl carrier protein
MTYEVRVGETNYTVEVARTTDGVRCRVNGQDVAMDAIPGGAGLISLLIDGRSYEARREAAGSQLYIAVDGVRVEVEIRDPRSLRARRERMAHEDGPRRLLAPMPGKVVRVLVALDSEVKAGQGVVVVEAMKMQNEIKSPKDGRVSKILAAEGAPVNTGDVLAIVE